MTMTQQAHDVMRRASIRAAALVPARDASGPLESQVEEAFISALVESDVDRARIGARMLRIKHCWDPVPGGIDLYLYADDRASARMVAELKVDAVDQTLWDLYKMIAALRLPTVEAAYLVVAANEKQWSKRGNCSELFSGRNEPLDSLDLFRRNSKAWCWLLAGGSARPTAIPSSVATDLIAREPLAHWPGYELRTIAVAPHGRTPRAFGSDGWPTQLADDEKECSKMSRQLAADLMLVAGYPVPRRFPPSRPATDTWLADHVPNMNTQQYAAFERELRGRQWKEHELDERVRPYRDQRI